MRIIYVNVNKEDIDDPCIQEALSYACSLRTAEPRSTIILTPQSFNYLDYKREINRIVKYEAMRNKILRGSL